MYNCMEGERGLLFEAMVFPLSELTAQAGRKPSLVDNAYVGSDPAVATEIDRTLSLLPRDIPG
jgi:hypothetical protein